MSRQQFVKRVSVNAPVETLFQYHERPGAFIRINPPWEPVELIHHTGGIRDGAKVDLKFKLGPVPIRWLLTHQNYIQNQQFEDVQVKGPFAYWRHTHKMLPDGPDKSILEDTIEYALPLGILGQLFGGAVARAKLERMFTYRHEVTVQDIAAHRAYPTLPLKIAVLGESQIGAALSAFLTTGGHTIFPTLQEGLDAVIHLENGDSFLLAESLSNLQHKPKVLIVVLEDYGNESSEAPIKLTGMRVVNAHMGKPLFSLMRGMFDSERQVFRWITLDDVISSLYHCLMTESLHGVV
ncbi:MAG: hypothetical protein K8I82_31265, partial [Anaerolineae bacterium]|nr:hypothetical protein [Anaerolineae bacterium]